jgi:hypothetical protein
LVLEEAVVGDVRKEPPLGVTEVPRMTWQEALGEVQVPQSPPQRLSSQVGSSQAVVLVVRVDVVLPQVWLVGPEAFTAVEVAVAVALREPTPVLVGMVATASS